MSLLEGVSDRIRELVVVTEVKEKQFTKWVRKRDMLDLYSWRSWFEGNGKTCRIVKANGKYALFVVQQWYEFKDNRGGRSLSQD